MSVPIPRSIQVAIEEMPAISPIVGKLRQIAGQLDSSPRDLVHVILLDPVLTGKVIRLVNSAFYGLSHRVQSLASAVVLLGVNTVRNLAISTAVVGAIRIEEKHTAIAPQVFWRHSLATAVMARLLAAEQGVDTKDRETYFVAGLLHDLGKVVLMKAEPEQYESVVKDADRHGVTLRFSEWAYFGFGHTKVGGLLARKWRLDEPLIEVIERHHDDRWVERGHDLLTVVTVANDLSKRVGFPGGNSIREEFGKRRLGDLGIDAEVVEGLLERLPSELRRAEEFLRIAEQDVA